MANIIAHTLAFAREKNSRKSRINTILLSEVSHEVMAID